MHNLGLRDLAFLSGGAAAGGSGGGGSGGGGSGSGGGGGGSGGTSALTLADFDAYWRMDGEDAGYGGGYTFGEDDLTGHGHKLYAGLTGNDRVAVSPGGLEFFYGPGIGNGSYRFLGFEDYAGSDYEDLNYYLRSWSGSGSPPPIAYPSLGAGDTYALVFFFKYDEGDGGFLSGWGESGAGIGLNFALYPPDVWHLAVLGRDAVSHERFLSIDGGAYTTQTDDDHELAYFGFFPGMGFPGNDGEYGTYEVLNARVDAAGMMLRKPTLEEIAWLWNTGEGREL